MGTFITRAGTFVLPFLSIYIVRERDLSTAYAGLALSLYGAGGMVASIAGGSLADRLGRKPVIVGAPLLGGLALLTLYASPTLAVLLPMSFVAGAVSEAGRPAVSAMITDLTPLDRRLDAFALYRLTINFGFAIGTLLGGLVAQLGFSVLFIGDAATSWAYAAVAFALLPETKPDAVPRREAGEADGFRAIFADRVFRRFWLGTLVMALAFSQPMATLPVVLTGRGMSPAGYGALISMNGFIILATEFWLVGITRRFRAPRVLALGTFLVGGGFALTAFAGANWWLLAATVAVWNFGEMLHAPTGQAYVSALAPPDLRGRYAGAFGVAWSVAFTIGPLAGGLALLAGGGALWFGTLLLGLISAALYLTLPELRRVPAPAPAVTPVGGAVEAAPA